MQEGWKNRFCIPYDGSKSAVQLIYSYREEEHTLFQCRVQLPTHTGWLYLHCVYMPYQITTCTWLYVPQAK